MSFAKVKKMILGTLLTAGVAGVLSGCSDGNINININYPEAFEETVSESEADIAGMEEQNGETISENGKESPVKESSSEEEAAVKVTGEVVDNGLFQMTVSRDYEGSYKIETSDDMIAVYDKEAMEADFGGYVFSVKACKYPGDYAGGIGKKVGEIKKDEEVLYDIVMEFASDVQYDYITYSDEAPESYMRLYEGAEDMVKTLKPVSEGEFIWGSGCLGDGMYTDIIDKHITAIKEKWDASRLEQEGMSTEYNVIDIATGGEAMKSVGYAYLDINLDGVEELLIGEIAEGNLKGVVYDIYTIVDRKPAHVVTGWSRNRYYALENGMICNEGSGGAALTEWQIIDIVPNSVEMIPQYSIKYDGYENEKNPWFICYGDDEWESITEEEAKDFLSRGVYLRLDFIPFSEIAEK
ncbi:MAG: hypothetical protein K6E98_08615 [Lachnospiraceae bacterium]|nr:hypothetical protein [Lachnospiraceae bacterium]